jgi:hypothetical protein
MIKLSSELRKLADFLKTSYEYWADKIKNTYGIQVQQHNNKEIVDDPVILRQIYLILSRMPAKIVKDCGVNTLSIRNDMGPNRPYYPNHGYYRDRSVTLNADIFYNPDEPIDFKDYRGYFVSRPAQTLIHEFGHAYDEFHGDLSLKSEWLSLSGWSKEPKEGLKRLIINDPGAPKVVGEYYYNPKAGFVRFYAHRNPWDDMADSFAFYMAGLKDKLPDNKRQYFDRILAKYK